MDRSRLPAMALLAAAWFTLAAQAAPKAPAIYFGKWLAVEWYAGPAEDQALPLKVRALYVNGRMRDYTLGEPHMVTDQLFVVRRAYRLNDALPEEKNSTPLWRWQRGGWLLVNRVRGSVSPLRLPDFDPYHSAAAWYRDYVAYCGLSDDGQKLYAVVVQLGRRKPVLRHELGPAHPGDRPDAQCAAPRWQRRSARVTFEPAGGAPQTFEVRGRAAEPAAAEQEEPAE